MTTFEEYRDRAYAFCKKLNLESAEMSNSKHDFAIHVHPQIFMVRLRDSEIIYTWHDPHGNGYFKDVTESEWIAAIEQHFGQPFPSLLEAQGCKKLTKEKLLSTSQSIIDAIKNATELNVDLNKVNWVDLQMEWYDWLEDEFGGAE